LPSSQYYHQQYPTIAVQSPGVVYYAQPVVTPVILYSDPSETCCSRYGKQLWGQNIRKWLTLLSLMLIIVGIILLAVSPSECPSGCVKRDCSDGDSDYSCLCVNGCSDATLVGSKAAVGITFLIAGVIYFIYAMRLDTNVNTMVGYHLFISLLITGFFIGPIEPLAIEISTECTYPTKESSVTAVLQVIGNILSAVLFPILIATRDDVSHSMEYGMWILASLLIFALCSFYTFNGHFRRLEQENTSHIPIHIHTHTNNKNTSVDPVQNYGSIQ